MSEEGDYLIQFTGMTVSLGEIAFKAVQTKLAGKLAEKGVTLHVASKYSSDVKRTKMQPYKFLVRNIWTSEKLEEACPEGIPHSPLGFGPVKGYPLGAFKTLKHDTKDRHVKSIPNIKETGKSNSTKIFICLKVPPQGEGRNIEEKLLNVLEVFKSDFGDNFQGHFLFKKHLAKGNEDNGDNFWDYACEIFVEKCIQESANNIEKTLASFQEEQQVQVSYGVFNDYASSQS